MKTVLVYLSIVWVLAIIILQAAAMYPRSLIVQQLFPSVAPIYFALHPLIYRDYIF